jgi:hypothetical protein
MSRTFARHVQASQFHGGLVTANAHLTAIKPGICILVGSVVSGPASSEEADRGRCAPHDLIGFHHIGGHDTQPGKRDPRGG